MPNVIRPRTHLNLSCREIKQLEKWISNYRSEKARIAKRKAERAKLKKHRRTTAKKNK
jgi:hypothetical protein